MARYPKYYVRPDGLHETILRINGKRKAFRGKTDKEVWEKVKAFDREADRVEAEKAAAFEKIAAPFFMSSICSGRGASRWVPGRDHRERDRPVYQGLLRHPRPENRGDPVADHPPDLPKGRSGWRYKLQPGQRREAASKPDADPPGRAPSGADRTHKKRRRPPLRPVCLPRLLHRLPPGGALALTGADIDRKKNLVHIKKSVYHVGNSPHIKQPKSDAGCRDVPLLPALAKLLPKKLGKGYLFAEPDGSLLTNDHFTGLYDAYRDASGVTVTPHQIRHGYATALLESGVDPKTAQVLLGHAQLSTTMDIYTHVRDGQLKAAAEKMEKGF